MRQLLSFFAALALVVGLSVPASASIVPFTGSISLVIAGLPGLPVPGGGLATVNNSGGLTKPLNALALPGGAFSTQISVPLPNAFPIVGLVVSAANNSAVFSSGQSACGTAHNQVTCSGGGALHGRSGLAGSTFVGLFGTATAPFANLTVGLGVVGGGSTSNLASPLGITLMLQGAGWTTGTIGVTNMTTGGGTSVLTAMGGQTEVGTMTNQVVLVTPLAVYTNATGGYLPSFASWTVNLFKPAVPEPGTLLLLGTAILGLVAYGRRVKRG